MTSGARELRAIMANEKLKRAPEWKQMMRLPYSRWHSWASVFVRAVRICPSKIRPDFACLSRSSN